jgi:hypothetical protein
VGYSYWTETRIHRVTKGTATEDPNGGIPCAWIVIFFLLTLTGKMEGSVGHGGRRCWPHRPRASSSVTCWLAAAVRGAAVSAQAAPQGQGANRVPTGGRPQGMWWPRATAGREPPRLRPPAVQAGRWGYPRRARRQPGHARRGAAERRRQAPHVWTARRRAWHVDSVTTTSPTCANNGDPREALTNILFILNKY